MTSTRPLRASISNSLNGQDMSRAKPQSAYDMLNLWAHLQTPPLLYTLQPQTVQLSSVGWTSQPLLDSSRLQSAILRAPKLVFVICLR